MYGHFLKTMAIGLFAGVTSIAQGGLVNNTLALDPVHYWRFSETTGANTASHIDTSVKDGTYHNSPTLGATGAPGFGAGNVSPHFSRDNQQYVSFADPDNLGGKSFADGDVTAISMSFWFRTDNHTSNIRQFLAGYQNTGASARYSFAVILNNVNYTTARLQFFMRDADGNQLIAQPSSFAITDDGWHHVAMTWDGAVLGMYLDGVQATASSAGVSGAVRASDYLFVGRDVDNSDTRYFDGQLDELAIFDYALTASQVNSLLVIPEPTSLALLGCVAVMAMRRRRRSGATS